VQTLKVILSNLDNLGRRLVKAYRYGSIDVQTPIQVSPFGLDSAPIKDMVAVYSKTDSDDTNVLLGYFNTNLLAEEGETRLFSTDAQGNVKNFIWLKKDGKMQLGGTVDHAVRYQKLQDGLDAMVSLINQNLPLIQSGIATAGGSYTPISVTLNISDAKIETITTP
jgi:hypothetical protein